MKAGYSAPASPAGLSGAAAGVRKPLPAAELQKAINDLAVRWQGEFNSASRDLARYFATAVNRRTDRALQAALDKSGITVNFRMTAATRDVVKATVEQNVQLIRTIPQQYLAGVQGDVMRSVQTGRDIGALAKDLQQKYGVTKRRAAFIARDQNNKATSAIQKTRQIELGLDRGVWMHSTGGKTPRPKHVRADGVEFDLKKGLKVGDDGGWVMPGEEPNCRCVWRAVVPGF
jgi:SPP1 gp7 family putative phage head morphogenesis protein